MIINGTLRSDTLTGTSAADSIMGGGAVSAPLDLADTIYAGGGDDTVYGNGGGDALSGQTGIDLLYGGGGADTINGGYSPSDATDSADTVYAGTENDLIYGAAGNDMLFGEEDSDTFYGGTGNDTLYGGKGIEDTTDAADVIHGDAGNDVIYGNSGNDTMYGGDGGDTIYGGIGNDLIYGYGFTAGSLDGADSITGGSGADTISGGGGADTLYGGSSYVDTLDGSDVIFGNHGSDIIYGNGGADSLSGEADDDTIYGGLGADTLSGGDGNDALYGDGTSSGTDDGGDVIAGGAGNDIIYGLGGSDNLSGDAGNDTIYGGMGINDASDSADTITGGAGDDLIYGNGGADSIGSGDGDDTIYGGAGINTMDGGAGIDTLFANFGDVVYGGAGSDRFMLDISALPSAPALPANIDTVSQLRIKDMALGEYLRVNSTQNTSISLSNISGGHVELAIRGYKVAVFENTRADQFRVTTSDDSTYYTLSTSSGSSGGGAVNTPPTLTGMDAATFLENTVNSSAQVIDAAVVFTDTDSSDLNGGNLTVTYNAGGTAEDYLSIRNQGSAAGQIGFDGTNVRYAGVLIGTIGSNGLSGDDLTVSFNSSATPTAVDALIQNLTYANDSNTPTANRTISITVNDGDGNTSAAATSVITVTAEAEVAAGAATFALSGLTGTNGFRLDGVAAADFSSYSTASAGDVNGDGFDDIIIGAKGADTNGLSSGSSYVVFGADSVFAATINLSSLTGTDGFRLDGDVAGDYAGFSVASAEDVNNDGFDDIIVGAKDADPNGASSGSSYVVFGAASGFAATMNLSSLNGTNGFRLDGVAANDYSGWAVDSAGDVNGDGFEDLIIGAAGATPNGAKSGSSYVVFGASSGFAATINLSSLNGTDGFRLDGEAANNYSGISVYSAGDVNGDGFDDVIVGASLASPNGVYSGSSYVVFGAASGFAATINLSSLNGTDGFRLDGVAANDFSGRIAASAGDVNGDGFDDVIIGAALADPNGAYSGSSYVVFGAASGFAATMNLSSLNGTNGFRLDGVAASDYSGRFVASAGDFNGDGLDDMIVSAHYADPNGGESGSSYVIFGKAAGWASSINLSSLDGSTGFRLDGEMANDSAGWSNASVGDLNGDGFDDLIIGASRAPSGAFTGATYVVYGNNDSGAATAVGTSGADIISGLVGNDVIVAGAGDDVVSGFDGNDVLKGANGDDALYGGAGTDKLFGGNGADSLYGGAGIDTLEGGTGIDRFIYTAIADSASGTSDVILDFNAAGDLLVFSGLLSGAFSFVGAHTNAFAGGGNSSARFNDSADLLQVDTNGDATVDMSITLRGVELANLSAADFSWS